RAAGGREAVGQRFAVALAGEERGGVRADVVSVVGRRSRAPRHAGGRMTRRASGHVKGRPSGGLRISTGTRKDAPPSVALLRGLAEYEKLAHECEATVAGVRRHGFGRTRYFETLICERDGAAIGFALYFFTFSTFLARPTLYLEDLFV